MHDFEALFRRHSKDLRRFLRRRLACSDTAADLAQEAFYRLMRAGGAPDSADARAYLFRIAANLATDHQRQSRRHVTGEGAELTLASMPDPGPSAERRALSREEWQVLLGAISRLPPRGRQVFLLHKEQGLSHVEIAQALGISKNTVIVHMMRGLAQCRRALAKHRTVGLSENIPHRRKIPSNGQPHPIRLTNVCKCE
ncbi:RNA polymerase sigma factor [Dongia sp.]|uniref:RNA polymerase sigma factor n=1 Tax=Dongia sp. TaxID=1977262 RepID=UPI0035ADC3E5